MHFSDSNGSLPIQAASQPAAPVICRMDPVDLETVDLETVTLDTIAAGLEVEVVSVTGEDALSERLLASGMWPGAVIERIASAPFGDPVLFRLHGYRLALRRSEAERIQVVAPQLDRTQLDRTQLDRTQLDRTQLDRTHMDRTPAAAVERSE